MQKICFTIFQVSYLKLYRYKNMPYEDTEYCAYQTNLTSSKYISV